MVRRHRPIIRQWCLEAQAELKPKNSVPLRVQACQPIVDFILNEKNEIGAYERKLIAKLLQGKLRGHHHLAREPEIKDLHDDEEQMADTIYEEHKLIGKKISRDKACELASERMGFQYNEDRVTALQNRIRHRRAKQAASAAPIAKKSAVKDIP